LAGRVGDAHVVDRHRVAGLRLGAGAHDVVDDLQIGGGGVAGEVDLGLLLGHGGCSFGYGRVSDRGGCRMRAGVSGLSGSSGQPTADRMSMTKTSVASPGMFGGDPASP